MKKRCDYLDFVLSLFSEIGILITSLVIICSFFADESQRLLSLGSGGIIACVGLLLVLVWLNRLSMFSVWNYLKVKKHKLEVSNQQSDRTPIYLLYVTSLPFVFSVILSDVMGFRLSEKALEWMGQAQVIAFLFFIIYQQMKRNFVRDYVWQNEIDDIQIEGILGFKANTL